MFVLDLIAISEIEMDEEPLGVGAYGAVYKGANGSSIHS